MFGYNAQAVVDDKNQIIVAADLHDKPTDYEALPDMIEQTEKNLGTVPKEVLADLGYKSVDNIKKLEKKGIEAVVAVGSNENEDAEEQFIEQISPTGKDHFYTCLRGKKLQLFAKRSDGRTEFKITAEFCEGCPHQGICKAFGKKTISIMKEENRLVMNRLFKKSRTEDFKEKYKQRKTIIEPVFGNIKNKGIKILVVGKGKVRTWWKMACTAHNIEKIIKNMALQEAYA